MTQSLKAFGHTKFYKNVASKLTDKCIICIMIPKYIECKTAGVLCWQLVWEKTLKRVFTACSLLHVGIMMFTMIIKVGNNPHTPPNIPCALLVTFVKIPDNHSRSQTYRSGHQTQENIITTRERATNVQLHLFAIIIKLWYFFCKQFQKYIFFI